MSTSSPHVSCWTRRDAIGKQTVNSIAFLSETERRSFGSFSWAPCEWAFHKVQINDHNIKGRGSSFVLWRKVVTAACAHACVCERARCNKGTPVREGAGGDHPRPCSHPETKPGGPLSHSPVLRCFQQLADEVSFQKEPCLPRLPRPSENVSQTTDWGPQKNK